MDITFITGKNFAFGGLKRYNFKEIKGFHIRRRWPKEVKMLSMRMISKKQKKILIFMRKLLI